MKNNYLAPQVEVIEIEIEDAILALSGDGDGETTTSVENFLYGSTFGDSF